MFLHRNLFIFASVTSLVAARNNSDSSCAGSLLLQKSRLIKSTWEPHHSSSTDAPHTLPLATVALRRSYGATFGPARFVETNYGLGMFAVASALVLVFAFLDIDKPSNTVIAAIIASFAISIVGLSSLNKDLIERLHAPFFVTASQCCVSAIAIALTQPCELKSFISADWSFWKQVRYWSPSGLIFFPLCLWTSMIAFDHVTISTMTIFRNLTPILALPVECIVMPANLRPVVSLQVCLALLCSLLGAIIFTDVSGFGSESILGISLVMLNCMVVIPEKLLNRWLLNNVCQDLNNATATFTLNLLGCVTLSVLTILTEKLVIPLQSFPSDLLFRICASGLMGVLVGKSGTALIKALPITAVSLLQNMVKALLILVGILFFGDQSSPMVITGCVINLFGVFWYAHSSQKQPASSDHDAGAAK